MSVTTWQSGSENEVRDTLTTNPRPITVKKMTVELDRFGYEQVEYHHHHVDRVEGDYLVGDGDRVWCPGGDCTYMTWGEA